MQYDRAVEDISRAIELDPEYALAYQNLSELKIVTGNYEDALKASEKAQQLSAGLKDDSICLYLQCISMRFLGRDVSDCESRLKVLLEKDFKLSWSFDEIEAWLAAAAITDESKKYIAELNGLMKNKK
jgi:tetratricopeptide (TPR) repeat protein